MKRYIGTLRVEVEAQSIEVRDAVLERAVQRITNKPPSILLDDAGLGVVVKVGVSRVRPKGKR